MSAPAASVCVVAVSYFGHHDVEGLYHSLRDGTVDDWRLVVVDNSGDDAERRALETLLGPDPRCRPVFAGANLGYLGGARLARSALAGESHAWWVLTNADIRFAPDFVATLARERSAAVIAPAIESGLSGADQNPFLERRPTAAQVRRWKAQFTWLPMARVARGVDVLLARSRGLLPNPPAGTRRGVYAGHGSCLAFSQRYFDAGGSWDHPVFLFGEEFTVAEQCRALGLELVHEPRIRVQHAEHRSTGWWRSRQMLEWQRESVRYVGELLSRSDA